MAKTTTIHIVKKRRLLGQKGQSWQYRWYLEAANGKQLANSGEFYWNLTDLMSTLHFIFGPRLGGHKLVNHTEEAG